MSLEDQIESRKLVRSAVIIMSTTISTMDGDDATRNDTVAEASCHRPDDDEVAGTTRAVIASDHPTNKPRTRVRAKSTESESSSLSTAESSTTEPPTSSSSSSSSSHGRRIAEAIVHFLASLHQPQTHAPVWPASESNAPARLLERRQRNTKLLGGIRLPRVGIHAQHAHPHHTPKST